jgi:hypothetical protein
MGLTDPRLFAACRTFAVLILGATPLQAPAQLIPGYSDNVLNYDSRELALLPPYCKYTQNFREKVTGGDDRVEAARWEALFGQAFFAMHHYCWGLMKANRGLFLARSKRTRDYYLNEAIVEYDYVIDRSQPGFVLLPELIARKGDLQLRLGHPGGLETIRKALSLKPDYWLPYALASDYYKSVGQPGPARQWLNEGIEKVGDAAPLKSRLDALDRPPRDRLESQ